MSDESEITAKEALVGIDSSLARIAESLELLTDTLVELISDDGKGIIGSGNRWSGEPFKYVRTVKVD